MTNGEGNDTREMKVHLDYTTVYSWHFRYDKLNSIMISIYSNYKKTKGYYNYEEKINIIYATYHSYQLLRV